MNHKLAQEHWTDEDFVERMRTEEWAGHLLAGEDIIKVGNLNRRLFATDIFPGVVEVRKRVIINPKQEIEAAVSMEKKDRTPLMQLLTQESINGRWKWEGFSNQREKEEWLDMETKFEFKDIAKMITWACKVKKFPRSKLVPRIIAAVVNNGVQRTAAAGKSDVEKDGSFYG